MDNYGGWEKLKLLGEGGQGRVFLARSPGRRSARETAKAQIRPSIWSLGRDAVEPQLLLESIAEYNRPDEPFELGALKEFKMPADQDENRQARGRLTAEIQALKKIEHPAVLKLLASSVDELYIVTEYHYRGTLDQHLSRYKGDALSALRAFRNLVDCVVEIHDHGVIHRDIKPENIFLSASGDLILGDFGIVFFADGQRLTKTRGERVGSYYWMAPWTYDPVRLESSQVKAPLDIYPLAKVLWSMISGRNGFTYWEYQEEANNLEKINPGDPSMPLVNGLLGKCIVRQEKDCIPSALMLRSAVDELIERVRIIQQGLREDGAETWPCRLCGKGTYRILSNVSVPGQISGGTISDRQPFAIYVLAPV